jgi:hypothetical protein
VARNIQRFEIRYSWFDRSLFLIGSETKDGIHQDWVRDRMMRVDLKNALLDLWESERIKARRLNQAEFKEILRGGPGGYDIASYSS